MSACAHVLRKARHRVIRINSIFVLGDRLFFNEREKEEEENKNTHLLPLFLESIVCKAYTYTPLHTTFTTNLFELLRREIVSQLNTTYTKKREIYVVRVVVIER